MHISVNNFQQINKEHGHEAGDIVLKLVAKTLKKHLSPMGVKFVAVAREGVSVGVQKAFKDTVDLILSKKFKTHAGQILNIELQLSHKVFEKGQSFHMLHESL